MRDTNLRPSANDLIQECFRWYGPRDTVSLADIRQCGATGVYTALHEIPYGEVWPVEAIRRRKAELEEYELTWAAVEPVPISEAIKSRTGDFERHIENYRETLRRLGREGIPVVLNCFMPVLEWVRTDLSRRLSDGKQCLSFNPVEFAAFEIFVLQRESSIKDYAPNQLEAAEAFFGSKSRFEQQQFGERICGMLPGAQVGFTIEELRQRLEVYQGIDADQLRRNLKLFLEAVAPVAEQFGVRLAMHPDDPPFPILGLPRIVSTEHDYREMLKMVDLPANGICLCTGSLGARADNDLPGMVERLGSRIHALHLRNVQREENGGFYESDHLAGSVNMPAVVTAILAEQFRRREQGRADWQLSMRPDHGHVMLDDFGKPPTKNPGYSCLGRMRGLAELRGLQHGIASSRPSPP